MSIEDVERSALKKIGSQLFSNKERGWFAKIFKTAQAAEKTASAQQPQGPQYQIDPQIIKEAMALSPEKRLALVQKVASQLPAEVAEHAVACGTDCANGEIQKQAQLAQIGDRLAAGLWGGFQKRAEDYVASLEQRQEQGALQEEAPAIAAALK